MNDMETMSNTAFVVVAAVLWTLAFVTYHVSNRRNKR